MNMMTKEVVATVIVFFTHQEMIYVLYKLCRFDKQHSAFSVGWAAGRAFGL